MGNRITRTVLFAASALLSISAFGAGAARFGKLRNSDWVVTNAWQAVSNKTHDLIIDMGQEASLPPDWMNVSNAAMSAVQSLLPVTNYVNESIASFSETGTVRSTSSSETSLWSLTADTLNDGGIQYSYSDIMSNMESKISTNNPAFVSAVIAAPLVGADPGDLSELAEYGSYGTVGAALLALIAGLAALKRRMTAEESAVGSKLDGAAAYPAWVQDDYQPPAIVSHKGRLWSCQNYTIAEPGEDPQSDWLEVTIKNLKQDVLTAAQLENIEAVPNKANAADVNAALAGKMPMYPMVSVTPTSGTLTVAPYTVATYTAGSTAAAFEVAVGAGTTGKARDCELVIDCTATGTVAPTVTWPATFHPRTDAGTDFACEAGVRNVYYISEYATGQFAVGGWQETAGGNA